ncbi:MAG: ActS/PrrB/RegB family redox-sensitive histidine kinase [Alphaproteobacteria bacterium]|nr:ActS/PrrB/RegB family redox-sensitive histidine kinase [Alphaproteobacteria bacterium]
MVSESTRVAAARSRLKLGTIVRLRWLAVLGQSLTVAFVTLGLGFDMPLGPSLLLIALSSWLNIYLQLRFPARFRLSNTFATALLVYDVLQLGGLLYLTGGIDNPFTMLLVAPVTVSAATLPLRNTVQLGVLALTVAAALMVYNMPLPWGSPTPPELPLVYRIGHFAAVTSCMVFLAIYAWRITKESGEMSDALAATEHVLAREQKLHALDGLAAAAAHELGTPLSTIVLVTKELEREMRNDGAHHDDIALVRSQAMRCREILQKLTKRSPEEEDPMHASFTIEELLTEGVAPYQNGLIQVQVSSGPRETAKGDGAEEPLGVRRPGILYGIGNIIENATEFAASKVAVTASWDDAEVALEIADDGPGFRPEVMDVLGDPYVTTRPAGAKRRDGKKTGGLGLGFFIAKTLLERSGARLNFENRAAPASGAVVRIVWPRHEFESKPAAGFQRFVPGLAMRSDYGS